MGKRIYSTDRSGREAGPFGGGFWDALPMQGRGLVTASVLAALLFAAHAPAATGPPPSVQSCGLVTFSKEPVSDGLIQGRHMACREARRIVKGCAIRGRLRSGWTGFRTSDGFKLIRDEDRRIRVSQMTGYAPKLGRCLDPFGREAGRLESERQTAAEIGEAVSAHIVAAQEAVLEPAV